MGKIKKQLAKAIKTNDFDFVWQLLQKDFDNSILNEVDKYNSTYLIDAVTHSSYEIVHLLLKYGADINCTNHSGDNPLSTAIETYFIVDRLKKVKLLLDFNPSIEITKYTLHLAASTGDNSDIVKLLIDYGCDVNLQDENGDTPLIKASFSSTGEQSLIYLIAANSNPNICNKYGMNCKLGVLGYGHTKILNYFQKHKIYLNNNICVSINFIQQIDTKSKAKFIAELPNYVNHLEQIIFFFSLPAQKQIAVLPNLDCIKKFDCGGDFYTQQSLMVLTLEYQYIINYLRGHFILLNEESSQSKYNFIPYITEQINSWITSQDVDKDDLWCKSSLLESKWIFIRESSKLLRQYFCLGELKIKEGNLKKIIIDCLHY